MYIPKLITFPHSTNSIPWIELFAADGLHRMILKFFKNKVEMFSSATRHFSILKLNYSYVK